MTFAREVFGVELDRWQEDALTRIGGPAQPRRRLVMKACTGPGKSAVLAIIGWHRLLCFADRGEHPKGAALSGEGRDNLRDNLWSELAKWQNRSKLLMHTFTWNKERIYANDYPETWFLSARSYPKDANMETIGTSLSGLHSRYPFILLDEIGNMPVAVGKKASQIFTGGVADGLIAAAGNPTSTSGMLYHTCINERQLWDLITITADPDDPKRTPRVDVEHAKEQIKLHGRDNPWVMATILGEFPPSGFNTLLSATEVEKAMGKHLSEDVYEFSQKRLGVDVARFGDDKTIIFPRQGLASFKPIEMRGARTNEIASRIALAKERWGSEFEFVDDTGGYGSGVVDSLLQSGLSPQAIHFAGKADEPNLYANKRAEIYFRMSKWIKRGGALPNIPELAAELTTPTYAFNNGKFIIESKDQIKDRLGRSPDLSDALALTFSFEEMPAANSSVIRESNFKSEWNPL